MRQGCLDPTMPGSLAAHLGVAGTTIEELLSSGDGPLGRTSACVPYVLVSGGEHGTASVSLHPAALQPLSPVEAAAALTPLAAPLRDCSATRRTLELPLRAVLDPDLSSDIPDHVRWQLEVLVPVMIVGLDAGGEAQGDALIRLVLEQDSTSPAEHLQSLEVLEAESRRRVDGVWWLERPDGPGMLFGLHGTDYERVLWQSPVHYSRFARGIKPAATVTRTVAVRRGKTSTRRTVVKTVKPRGYHLGVDLVAAKGEEVHAVANARVAFAGRRRGFGNLVVLDHGEGYQTYYAHLSAIRDGVVMGAPIDRGQIVGLVGSTGHSTGPHLHFEVHRGDAFIDPFDASREPDIWTLKTTEQEWLAQQALLSGTTPVENVPSRGLSLVFERGNPEVRTDAWATRPFGCAADPRPTERTSRRLVGPQP